MAIKSAMSGTSFTLKASAGASVLLSNVSACDWLVSAATTSNQTVTPANDTVTSVSSAMSGSGVMTPTWMSKADESSVGVELVGSQLLPADSVTVMLLEPMLAAVVTPSVYAAR